MKIETGKANPDHRSTVKDIAAQVIGICIEAILDHNTRIDIATTGAAHDYLTQLTEDTVTELAMTHHTGNIANHPNIEALQVINPEIAVGHIPSYPTDLQGINHADQIYTPAG